MNRPRFSVAWLLGMVVVLAVALAAMRTASVYWTAAAATITLALLLTGVLGGLFLRGSGRAFWAGFAIFGWVYLLFVNWDWIGAQFGHDLTGFFSDCAEMVFTDPTPVTNRPTSRPGALPQVGPALMDQLLFRNHAIGNFVQILRYLSCLVFALVGGIIARVFAARSESRREP